MIPHRVAPVILFLLLAVAPARADLGDPIRIDALGIELRPPAGATVRNQTMGDRVELNIFDAGAPAKWSIRFLTSRTLLGANATAEDQINHLLTSRRDQGDDLSILTRQQVDCGAAQAEWCVAEQTLPNDERLVLGWFCAPMGGGIMLVGLTNIDPDYIKPSIETLWESINSIVITDLASVVDQRATRLAAGESYLGGLTPEQLQAIEMSQWYRTTRRDDSGREAEIGGLFVEARTGMRGEVNEGRRPENFDPAEREEGLLVSVLVRGFAGDTTIRTVGRMWVAWDQSAEVWSIRQTLALGEREQSSAVSGIRTAPAPGQPRGLLQVIIQSAEGARRDAPNPAPVPDSYFSQAFRWIEGRVLAAAGSGPLAELGYYCVDTSSDRVAITPRIDEIEPRIGGFIVRSRPRTDGAVTMSQYDAEGRLVERTWPDGSVTRPIELAGLLAAWRRAGIDPGDIR